jgi:xanthine dehydrogenase accessory factor
MSGTELLAKADRLRGQRTPFVLATVVRAEKPTSAKAGDRAIVLPDGTIEGFVGGVCAESTVRVEGLRLLGGDAPDRGDSTLLRITPADESGAVTTTQTELEGLLVVANPCLSGGTLDIFLEAVRPAALLHIHGEAPIAHALASVAAAAGYEVVQATDPEHPLAPDTHALVVASHGRDEERVLTDALKAGIPYVGLVASRRRGSAIVDSLEVPDDLRGRVKTPAGLDIGAHTALEVAVSIVAELISSRPAPVAATARRQLPVLSPNTVLSSTAMPSTVAPAAAATGPVEAIDPVCHMTVAAVPSSLHLEHEGVTYYFCAPGCRKAFAADPARYLS